MTKVQLTKAAGGHDAGTTIDVTPGVAAQLIERGAATEVQVTKPEHKADSKPRRSGSNDRSEGKGKVKGVGVDSPPHQPRGTAG